GFAAALASGDRSFMPQSDQEALRASGLAHLLAISGLHMGIVGGLVFLFVWRGLALVEPIALRVSVKKPAAMTALIACAVYLVISGASVSTQRAFIMSAVLFGAVLFDRTALSLRSLSIAMIAILALAPWSVLTPGFQMSFAATGALIATYEGWQHLQRKRGLVRRRGVSFWLKSLVVTSTVSSFATMPFAMYHFDRVAGLGIFANLFAMPIISMVSAPLAALALLLAPLGGDGLALRLFGLSLEAVLNIAHIFAGFGEARWLTLPAMPAAALGWFAAAIAIYVTELRAMPKAVSMMLICILAGGTWHLSAKERIHFSPSGELFLEHASGRVDRVELRNGPGLPPLRFIDAPISQVCEIGTPCILQSERATIAYADNTIVEEGFLVTSSKGTVKTRILWSDVIRENGVTLEWQRDGFHKRDKPACGHRRWRACSKD
ncbi:MAG: ComEC/Rec2 family competence protein, partial [Pseudomonadota bacterium]